MPVCLDVPGWRIATADELIAFTKGIQDKSGGPESRIVVRSKLTQADVYTYLRARFGNPNGFQNFLRKDDSDNLIHWDFNLKAGAIDIYIQGRMRDIDIMVREEMTDADWKALILAIRADFGRVGPDKSQMLRSFEKFVVFQNKFATLANLCGDLHATIVDAPAMIETLPRLKAEGDIEALKAVMEGVSKRATNLYADCLKLRLLTPVMAEAFINMLILVFCKNEIRDDRDKYDAFVREKIPQKLELLHQNCVGFARKVDPASDAYRDFLRVMNRRNFAIHGNVDPVREQIETVYFEGKRPIFADNGDHILKLFEHLEAINTPQDVIKDYEAVHLFLAELHQLLLPRYHAFFEQVIDDPYPGYEIRAKRVTKILPSHNAAMMFPGEKYDDDLAVTW